MSERIALLTGSTGQDGSYLAELLLDEGYQVDGMVRRSSTENFECIQHLRGRIALHQADLLDPSSLVSLLQSVRPTELYNLGTQSFVPTSWGQPTLTGEFTEIAFDHVGLDPADFVRVDPAFLRPAEVDQLLADPTKAREQLGWSSRTSFEDLVQVMVEADLEAQERSSGRRRGGAGSR